MKSQASVGSSSGGHNGLNSIHDNGFTNFLQIRIGVGRTGIGRSRDENVAGYVLSRFSQGELSVLLPLLERAAWYSPMLFSGKLEQFNTRMAEIRATYIRWCREDVNRMNLDDDQILE